MYALENDKLFEWRAVQRFCSSAPALPLLFATPEDEIAHPLKFKRPEKSRAAVVELDAERNVVRSEALPRIELCSKEGVSLVYGGEEPSPAKVNKMGSRKRRLSSWMKSTGKQSNTTTRSDRGEDACRTGT